MDFWLQLWWRKFVIFIWQFRYLKNTLVLAECLCLLFRMNIFNLFMFAFLKICLLFNLFMTWTYLICLWHEHFYLTICLCFLKIKILRKSINCRKLHADFVFLYKNWLVFPLEWSILFLLLSFLLSLLSLVILVSSSDWIANAVATTAASYAPSLGQLSWLFQIENCFWNQF